MIGFLLCQPTLYLSARPHEPLSLSLDKRTNNRTSQPTQFISRRLIQFYDDGIHVVVLSPLYMHCQNIMSKVLRDEEPPGRSNSLLKGNKSIAVVSKQSTKIPVPHVATERSSSK